MQDRELRDKCEKEFSRLRRDRSQYEYVWDDVREKTHYEHECRRFRFDSAKRDKRSRVSEEHYLLDPHARFALRTLRSGLHGGMTSPSRPWFKLGVTDPDLTDSPAVREWFFPIERTMREVFRASNVYSAVQQMYKQCGNYGSAAMFLRPDPYSVLHCHPMEIGEFWLAADERGRANTVIRRSTVTISQAAERYGLENLSQHSRNLYDRGQYHEEIDVVIQIKPRRKRSLTGVGNRNLPYMLIAYEEGSDKGNILQVSGVDDNAVAVSRWETAGYEPYGVSSCGIDALSDARQLQWYAMQKAQAIDTALRPPLQGPAMLKSHDKNFYPGGITYLADVDLQRGGLRPVFETNFDMNPLREEIAEERRRVDQAYFVDLFLMFQNPGVVTGDKPTAEQIVRQHEEKLVMLGPVLENLSGELLQPLIERTFSLMQSQNLIPPPPEEIQGQEIKIEYVSVLAQAQKLAGLNPIERGMNIIGTAAQLDPSVIDHFDAREAIEEAFDVIGAPPQTLRSRDEVAAIQQQRAQQQQLAAAAEAAPGVAQAANLLSEAAQRSDPALPGRGII